MQRAALGHDGGTPHPNRGSPPHRPSNVLYWIARHWIAVFCPLPCCISLVRWCCGGVFLDVCAPIPKEEGAREGGPGTQHCCPEVHCTPKHSTALCNAAGPCAGHSTALYLHLYRSVLSRAVLHHRPLCCAVSTYEGRCSAPGRATMMTRTTSGSPSLLPSSPRCRWRWSYPQDPAPPVRVANLCSGPTGGLGQGSL